MATNLDIDDALLERAREVGGHRTKKATVIEALTEYIQRHEQLRIPELAGRIDYYRDYDHKKARRKR